MSNKQHLFPNIVDLVPHAGEMVMLHRVVCWHGREVVVAADLVRPNIMAGENGRIPGYVGLEFMAQGISAAAGLERRAEGKDPIIGLVLGARKYQAFVSYFPTEGEIHVRVRETFVQNPVAVFEASISLGNKCLARGEIKVTQPDSEETLRKVLAS